MPGPGRQHCSTLSRVEPYATLSSLTHHLHEFLLAVPSLGSSPTQQPHNLTTASGSTLLAVPSLGSSPTQRCTTLLSYMTVNILQYPLSGRALRNCYPESRTH